MSDLSVVLDPYKAATGWTPWSYFYAVAKDDEVALFWSTVFGGASVGSYIGSYLARGGYYASGGFAGKAFLSRFGPLGMLFTSAQLQYELGAVTDTQTENAFHFAAAGDPSASPMMTLGPGAEIDDLRISWKDVKTLFGF